MLRRFLACLALLTGLTAAGAPVQAEMANALASHVEASASGVPTARSQVTIAIARPALGRPFAVESPARPFADQIEAAPAVLLGSDRARE